MSKINLGNIKKLKCRGAPLRAPIRDLHMPGIHERKTIRLDRDLYRKQCQPFSFTICSNDRISLLDKFRDLIFKSIMEGDLRRKSDLIAVCVMPDHVHLLLAPISENLIDPISRWKGYTTHLVWDHGYKGKLWQRSFYDHALRKEEDLIRVAEYIVCNPVRRGLVQDFSLYPYSWHKWMNWAATESRPYGL